MPDLIASRFLQWRRDRHTALIPYITAGYPNQEDTLALLIALADAGADLIELGVPFSDPVADGPTIQRASQVALENGVTLDWVLHVLSEFRSARPTPVIIFSYLNPILNFGVDRFVSAAVAAGAQGVLIVDLPVDSDRVLEDALENSPLSLIRLLAPTTPRERRLHIMQHTQGFLYYVARLGVTGARASLRADLVRELTDLRAAADVPIAVGFGISTPEQAQAVAAAADGIVVGSALIAALERSGVAGAAAWLRQLRSGLDAR